VPPDWVPFYNFLTGHVCPLIQGAILQGLGLSVQRPTVLFSRYFPADSAPGVAGKGQQAHRDYSTEKVLPHLRRDPIHLPVSFLQTLSPNGGLRFWSGSLDSDYVTQSEGVLVTLPQAGDAALFHGLGVHEGVEYVPTTVTQHWAFQELDVPKECLHVRWHCYTSFFDPALGATRRLQDRWSWHGETELVPVRY
jgi:hypothetical protein